jgi:DNA replication protein DnaC
MDGYKVCKDEYGQDYAVPTKEGTEEQRRLRLKLLLKDTGVVAPSHGLSEYRGEDRAGNILKIKKYVAEFDAKFRNIHLYLWSRGNASQKTTVAKNIVVELALKGFECRFVLMADLISLLQTETYNHGSESKAVSVLRNTDFLVIDDAFDSKKATLYRSGYQFSFVDTFLRYRLETGCRATCFTSNIPIDEIGKTWTPSIMSLVKRSVPTPMEFSDYITDFKAEDIWS